MPLFRRLPCLLLIVMLGYGCANITPPLGGVKDIIPPQLLSVVPADSQLESRIKKIELHFDEYITVTNASTEIQISPLLAVPLSVEGLYRKVTVRIPDTLLQDQTTYRISFGNAIKDLNENNPFAGYHFMFSTGSYFDSLRLGGYIVNGATGAKDSSALILLYDAAKSDSIVVREKPLYITRADAAGNFRFEGLPDKPFQIFALQDANDNMIYDGKGEKIAFITGTVRPADSIADPVRLVLFEEEDTSTVVETMPVATTKSRRLSAASEREAAAFNYTVAIDTSDLRRRTVSITEPLKISFSKPLGTIDESRIRLSIDSNETSYDVPVTVVRDTTNKTLLQLDTEWQEDMVYTLRLLKDFAQDTAGTGVMPARYTFRTKREDDYAKLRVNLPSAYYGEEYLFLLLQDHDSIYQQQVSDTVLLFTKLDPGSYTFRIIVDKNKNGKWDTGNFFGKTQPEEVIPWNSSVGLRAGWDNTVDFNEEEEKSGR